MSNDWENKLDLLIKSRTPIIWIRSPEEERIERLLEQSCDRLGKRLLLRWDFIEGLQGQSNKQGYARRNPMAALDCLDDLSNKQPTLLLLLDFHKYCEDNAILRRLRNLSRQLRQQPHILVITANEWKLPPELEECIAVLDLPLPGTEEVHQLLESIAKITGVPLDIDVARSLTQSCRGLTEQRIRQTSARALVLKGCLGAGTLDNILEEKRQTIARSELLEYCSTDCTTSDISGLDNLKEWLHQRYLAFQDGARKYGLPLPRGVLLVGPQGTGKSLTAKVIAHTWGMPLLRLDIGRLFAGLVGASEARTREMIRLAEAMAPCILWIDEIDKAFSGDRHSDGGTSQRVLASLLTWMAEKESAVFVVATANSIEWLPPELIRKGRFDEIFLLGLPTMKERRAILELHLKRHRPNHNIPLEIIIDRTEDFSGAELEQTVIEAMHLGFGQNRDFNELDMIQAAGNIIPLARTVREKISTLMEWAKTGRVRLASKG
ncbi:AAA ATPase (chromatophore) [Paulinella micropora]|uniref:Uncharacterized AAA domain-containing protein ycf46 n=1 Tax=Paulinella micropora TaxID=1928728 RepID=A0A1L5YCP4_9EUKA|nr:AAA ATPase superfamily:AAA-protein [Paulinella micropora]AQX45242.1 AAA ATPase superfamily:AAA-protein [Paulinella micropora]BBL86460.1 AAA ATPase [Paulinella micropora]